MSIRGNSVAKSKIYVHIQCPWRLLHQDKILVGSDDFYIPATGMDELEDFIGATRFDEKRNKFFSVIESTALVVLKVVVDRLGGLTLKFGNDYVLEAFPCDSNNEEAWRLGNLSVGEDDKDRSLVVTSP